MCRRQPSWRRPEVYVSIGDASRPVDIVVLDFSDADRHLVIDVLVTTVYHNTVLDKVASVPGYAAKLVEDRKFMKDADSPQHVAVATGGRHTFVSFAMEDGGRLGTHAHATLKLLAEYVVVKGRLPPRARHVAPPLPPVTVALWIRR